jgi:acyl-coenzyme A synthetase/AMP-(fatty) acid ligase
MNFWDLDYPGPRLALIDEASGRRWSYGDLKQAAAFFGTILGSGKCKQLAFILCANSPECVAAYIGSLQSGTAAALFSADLSTELLSRLLAIYRPDWVVAGPSMERLGNYTTMATIGDYEVWGSQVKEREIKKELGLLLSTSGSTGTPKLVRLSYSNLQANAASIGQYLGLDECERPVTSLSMAYSYGLSVINSHLAAGASILLTTKSVLQKNFWDFVCAERATSFAGVPYTYQMLLRTGLLRRDLPIVTWTQAGGRLDPRYIEQVHAIARARGWRFVVMYGQTEATARISYVPPELLECNVGSIGTAIPGGHLRLDPESSELVYSGPNVMLGYAENIQDLSKGDELNGELYTGDLARQNENGFFHITGRKKRFLKLVGLRLSLDDMETTLGKHFDTPIACFGTDDALQIAVEDVALTGAVRRMCCDEFKLHHSVISVSHVDQLPLTSNGKVDYVALAALAPASSELAAAPQPAMKEATLEQ